MLDHVLGVLPAFLLACVALAALPGPATALFIHRTVRDGRSAGLAAVAGNEIGLFMWLLAGGAGVSALRAANPKAAIVAISFLPQFLPRHGPLLPTVLVLATVQVTLDTIYCSGIVLLADRARRLLQRGDIRRRIERGLGLVLVGLGCELALEATAR